MVEVPSMNFPPDGGTADKPAESLVSSELGTLPSTPDFILALLGILVAPGLEVEDVPKPVPRAAFGPS